MSVDSFRFVSPGVFINEIDESQIPGPAAPGAGPVIMGVARKGPALVPITVSSYKEFVDLFGNPEPGSTANADTWRSGNRANPTYGAYAAQAYLANAGPMTYIRLVGDQDPTATAAGQAGWEVPRLTPSSDGGAYGLFIIGSGSTGAPGHPAGHGEGTLAAIFYVTGSGTTVRLKGRPAGGTEFPVSAVTASSAMLMDPVTVGAAGTAAEFKVVISGSKETVETTFNFNPKSGRHIRKVFNTNPHLLNTAITDPANQKDYFLGQSYGQAVLDNVTALDDNAAITMDDFSNTVAVILGLVSSSAGGGNFRQGYRTPGTPWLVGQDMTDNIGSFDVNSSVEPLFRLHSRQGVEYAQSNYKISISDIKQSSNTNFNPYGTFTVLVRDIRDTDENPVILEQLDLLNLNPASNNFIGKRIGDRSYSWDTTNKKWNVDGQYDVQSKYLRVECSDLVNAGGQEAALLPFGYRGIPVHQGFNIVRSGSTGTGIYKYSLTAGTSSAPADSIFCSGGSGSMPSLSLDHQRFEVLGGAPSQVAFFRTGSATVSTASLAMPALPTRASAADGNLMRQTNAFFGLSTNQGPATQIFDGTIQDLVRILPVGLEAGRTILSPGFSLDDLSGSGAGNTGTAQYASQDLGTYNTAILGTATAINSLDPYRGTPSNARRLGTSFTAETGSYTGVLDRGWNKFTVPLYGGFDGFDIFERNPFNNTRALGGAGSSGKATNAFPMWYTLKKAIDSVSDVDQININMAAVPGVTDLDTTNHLLAMAEERKDTLAIIDLEYGYRPVTEGSATGPEPFNDRRGSSALTITNAKARNFNTSYGCTYYPWLQINDTLNSTRVWVPPSTVALGVMASSAARSELWFAPAGFNRGGLNNGNAGLNVLNVIEKLTATQRDNLYEENINPIASFPAEGIVVFGQKTLQATPSALDRINVRRLMIYLKKQITLISNGILFDPNVQITWNRFTNRVDPFLSSIKQRFGLADYRVILDASTTTADLVDRNILYAKILLKPTRAIEFIALDFVITRSGVEF